MIKKIIYISYLPLMEYSRMNFYIDSIRYEGFDVEYWDLTKVYFNNLVMDAIDVDYIRKFDVLKDVELEIVKQQNNNCLYVVNITYEYRVLNLFRLFTKYNCKTSFFARGAMPSSIYHTSLGVKILKALNPSRLRIYILNKYAAYLKQTGIVKPYDFIFNAGYLGFVTVGVAYDIERKTSKIIDINSIDYEKYLNAIETENLIGHNYCLFLDECLPSHPDTVMLGIKTMPPVDYYKDLNVFFDFLESNYKIPVVIAAHPKSGGYKINNPFNGRKVVSNKTAELARHCDFAMSHLSTSLSYAVLNNKPILSLTNNLFESYMPDYHRWIADMSEVLGSNLIDMDNYKKDDINIYTVNEKKYDNYKFQYLTSKSSENIKTGDIFISLLKQL